MLSSGSCAPRRLPGGCRLSAVMGSQMRPLSLRRHVVAQGSSHALPVLQLRLGHGAREVPQGVLRAAGGHRAVLRDGAEVSGRGLAPGLGRPGTEPLLPLPHPWSGWGAPPERRPTPALFLIPNPHPGPLSFSPGPGGHPAAEAPATELPVQEHRAVQALPPGAGPPPRPPALARLLPPPIPSSSPTPPALTCAGLEGPVWVSCLLNRFQGKSPRPHHTWCTNIESDFLDGLWD